MSLQLGKSLLLCLHMLMLTDTRTYIKNKSILPNLWLK